MGENHMRVHGEIAIDLAQLPVNPLPDCVPCARRDAKRAKQCGNQFLGMDT